MVVGRIILGTALICAFSSAASAQQASGSQRTTCREGKTCPAAADDCKEQQQRKVTQPPRVRRYIPM